MQKMYLKKSGLLRMLSTMLAAVITVSCFAIGIPPAEVKADTPAASGAAAITKNGNTWTMENQVLKTVVSFENGSIKLTSFYNKAADKEYLTDNADSYLFSYTYGEYIPGTVWSVASFNAAGSVPAAGKNLVTMRSDDGSWTLGNTKISDITMIPEVGKTEVLGKQLEITLTNSANKFQVKLVFGVYDGESGFHYQNYVKNAGDKKMVITASDVISLSFPNQPHYLHYINALTSSSNGAENSTWKTVTGSLAKNTGRNALNVYTGGDGWWIMPETNWRTQDGPDVPGAKPSDTKTFNEFATASVIAGGNTSPTTAPIKVACVGDSITNGSGASSGATNYPAQLQAVLGSAFEVKNFGVGGRTLLKKGDYPYWNESAYTDSKSYQPDIVIIMLGTNDSKPQNWQYKDEYKSDYIELINQYKSLASKPVVYVATSPIVAKDSLNISASIVTNEIVPLQKQIADETGCPVIDINAFTTGHTEWYTSDSVHPNDLGYANLAKCFAASVKTYQYPAESRMKVSVSTNPQSMQLTLKPGEEFQYIGVNITVFKGDVVDGKMAAEEHFQKRFKFHDTTSILNTNDWDYIGKRSYEYFRDVIIPQASKAKVDMVMIDDWWNLTNPGDDKDRDGITAVPNLKSLTDLGNMIADAGMKFGIWYSMTGYDHNGGRDLADPVKLNEKKEQIRTLITEYKMAHEMIDLTEFWQNKTETSYSSPCDNVYRKNVMSNQMLNSLVAEYPDFMVKLTNEVDVYPTQGNRNNGLLHLADNGWLVHNGGLSGGMAAGANAFGYLPLSTFYSGGPVDGAMSIYYHYMFARNVKLNEDPGGPAWTDHGVELMATFNGWRKGERVKALTDEVKRPTYLGEGWNGNDGAAWVANGIGGPYSWMYTNADKSRALLIATSYKSAAKKIAVDTRWVDASKHYLVADVTLDDVGQFTYQYKGVYSGSDLTANGFAVDLTENSSGGKAYWFEAVGDDSMQVVYADEKAVSYSSSVSGDTLTVTVNGTPGDTATVIVADSENNKGRVCPVMIGQSGSTSFSVPASKLYAPSADGGSSNLGAPVRVEFETMVDSGKVSGSNSGVTYSAASTDASPSGGRYGVIAFAGVGDYATLKFNVPASGDYDLKLGYKVNEKCGKVSLRQNGAAVSEVVDQSLGSLNTWLPQTARVTFAHAGENEIQIYYEGKGAREGAPASEGKSIRVDYIEYAPHTAADATMIEAESLQSSAAASAGGTLTVASDPAASGGKYLAMTASSAGTVVRLPVTVPIAGNYQVTVNYRTDAAGGRIQPIAGGKALSNEVTDTYVSSGNAIKSLDLGTLGFAKSSADAVALIVTGRSAANTAGYNLGIDSITLTPAPAMQVDPAGGIVTLGGTFDLTDVFSVVNMQPSYCVPSTIDWKVVSESNFDVGEVDGDGILTANNPGTVVIRGSNKYDYTVYNEYTLTVVPSGTGAAVAEAIEAINLIGKPVYTEACGEAITLAETLYAALSDTQKEQVSNHYLLKSARYEYDLLKAGQGADSSAAAISYVEDLSYLTDGSSKITPGYNPNGSAMQYIEDGTVYTHGFGFEPLSNSSAATGTMIVPVPKGADKFYARVGLGTSASLGSTYDEKNVVNFKIDGQQLATTGVIKKNYQNGAWVDNTKQIEFAVPAGAEWLVIENYNGGINHADHIIFTDARFENTPVVNVIGLISAISPSGVNISEFKTETAEKIDAAEQAYYALDAVSRGLVTNSALLVTYRQTHSGFGLLLLTDPAVKAKLSDVNAKIQSLPQVKNLHLGDKAAVAAARQAFDGLSHTETYYVNNIDTLIAAEEYFASFSEAELAAVQKVIDKIAELPVTDEAMVKSDHVRISAARAAYQALSAELRPLVDNVDALVTAETIYQRKFSGEVLYGDVNGDEAVTPEDVILLRSLIRSGGATEAQKAAGDLNGDGSLTDADVTLLLAALNILPGDVSGEGSISALDVMTMRKLMLNDSATSRQIAAGDLSGDGELGALDIMLLRKQLMN